MSSYASLKSNSKKPKAYQKIEDKRLTIGITFDEALKIMIEEKG